MLRERGKGGGKGEGREERTLKGIGEIWRQEKWKGNGEKSERRGWEFEEVDCIRQLLFSFFSKLCSLEEILVFTNFLTCPKAR